MNMKTYGICLICGKKLSKKKYSYCKSCRLRLQWINGIRTSKERHFSHCIECDRELTSYRKKSRCRKCWKLFNKGKNHPLYKIDKFCKDCGKNIYKYATGIRCRTCNNKYQSNNKNGRWIDGRSYKGYSSFFISISKLIRKRDNYTCQICGLIEEEYRKKAKRALDVHHIDHKKDNNKESNLITVCRKCHKEL